MYAIQAWNTSCTGNKHLMIGLPVQATTKSKSLVSLITSIYIQGENISFDASLVIYINSTNIPPIMIINRIYETQNLMSL